MNPVDKKDGAKTIDIQEKTKDQYRELYVLQYVQGMDFLDRQKA